MHGFHTWKFTCIFKDVAHIQLQHLLQVSMPGDLTTDQLPGFPYGLDRWKRSRDVEANGVDRAYRANGPAWGQSDEKDRRGAHGHPVWRPNQGVRITVKTRLKGTPAGVRKRKETPLATPRMS